MVGEILLSLGTLLLYLVTSFVVGILAGIPCHLWRHFHPRPGDSESGHRMVASFLAAFLGSTGYGLVWAIPEVLRHPDRFAQMVGNFGFVYATLPLTLAGAALAGYLVRRFVPRVAP